MGWLLAMVAALRAHSLTDAEIERAMAVIGPIPLTLTTKQALALLDKALAAAENKPT